MHHTINCTISVKIQDSQLNINGLIAAMEEFCRYVLGVEFLQMILQAIERNVIEQLRQRSPQQYEHRGYQARQFRSSLGLLKLRFTRLRDRATQRTWCPGLAIFHCPAYVRWTDQVMTEAAGLLPFMSFKRSSAEYAQHHGDSPSKSTIHRRLEGLVGTEGDYQPYLKNRQFSHLMIDGTGARFQMRSEAEGDTFYKGEVRFAYASTGINRPYELVGLWIDKSWQECADDLYSRMSTQRLELLISDGEEAIASAFLQPHMRHQRCIVHSIRDLGFAMYGDGQKKKDQEEMVKAMHHISLPVQTQNDYEELTGESLSAVKEARERIKIGMDYLSEIARQRGLVKAAQYLSHLAQPFITCLDYYIETGKLAPITTNILERQIGLFKNRFNRVGRRWSENGLARWFGIAIRKLLPQFDWKQSWSEILGAKDAIALTMESCSIC